MSILLQSNHNPQNNPETSDTGVCSPETGPSPMDTDEIVVKPKELGDSIPDNGDDKLTEIPPPKESDAMSTDGNPSTDVGNPSERTENPSAKIGNCGNQPLCEFWCDQLVHRVHALQYIDALRSGLYMLYPSALLRRMNYS